MLKFSAEQIKGVLKVHLVIKHFGITDSVLIEYLKRSVGSDGDLYIHDISDALDIVFDFHFDFIGVPGDIAEEHLNGYNYYIVAALRIPELLPYVNHPSFLEFTRQIQVIEHGNGSGDLIEMVYLPDSVMATENEVEIRDFANQPATFLIGMQDNGGMDLFSTVQFLLDLREVNDAIMSLINGDSERGEHAA